ncbi:hypothetical protein BURK1_01511 [Burkholderiales bacterium]|nr:hypothetical protein BURK1_01511 [Burkholderiales bacterium]
MALPFGTSRGEELRPVLMRAGLWSLLIFGSNLVWEIAQVRLYTLWAVEEGPTIAWALLHCSVGDVMIAGAMYAVAGIALRSADWPTSRPWTGGAIVVIGATAFTAWSEWYNVYRAGNWGYAAGMPLVFGIGLSPLLQWIILPAAMVGALRALSPVLFGTRTSRQLLPPHGRTKGPT